MAKDAIIYDHTGEPVKKDEDKTTEPLPAGVQALIETRLNSAICQFREKNQDKLR